MGDFSRLLPTWNDCWALKARFGKFLGSACCRELAAEASDRERFEFGIMGMRLIGALCASLQYAMAGAGKTKRLYAVFS